MKIGFTGTQLGMKVMQEQFVFNAIMDADPEEFHHGMCIGADEQAHTMTSYLPRTTRVIGHPPINQYKMAADLNCDEVREPKEFLVRNKDIVDETDALIAAPKGPEEIRSGTWSTIRYARKAGKPVYIVWPDGTTEWRR